jgi:Cysteine dioxygenase type I
MDTINRFVEGLCAINESEFTIPRVARYVLEHPVDPVSLEPYLFYTATHYTRNLIHKSDIFELIAICWDIGQVSQIHNHQNQNCWMAVPVGCLAVQNYHLVRFDEKGFCQLKKANRVIMDPQNPSFVDPAMPIHAVLNLPKFRQRATSLHIYSRPYDRCLVYSVQKSSYWGVALSYDSQYGIRS